MDEDEEIEFDWTSSYAIPHISFILSQAAPLRHCTGDIVQQAQQQVTAQLGNQFKKGITALLCGGLFDGYVIPLYLGKKDPQQSIALQYDIIALLEDTTVVKSIKNLANNPVLVIDNTKNKPGFTRLEVVPKSGVVDVHLQGQHVLNGKTYFSSTAIQAHVMKELELPVQDNITKHCSVGLRLKTWPPGALKWTTRERKSNWPQKNLIKAVSEELCLLIPGSHPQSFNKHLEWTYCFSGPERMLFRNINPIQRQCMALFTILRDQSLSFPCVLSDYHLKTVFMWACERIPSEEWTYNTMGTYFIYLIDFLMEAAIHQNLPHYFIPEWNLFDEIAEDFQDHLLRVLADIRSSPLQPFYDFMKEKTLSYLPHSTNICGIIDIIEKDKAHDDYTSILRKHAECVLVVCKGLLLENKVDEALQVLHLHQLSKFYMVLPEFSSPVNQLSNIALQTNADVAIAVFQQLQSLQPKASTLGNLACMYHVKYATAKEEDKEEYKKKTQDSFLMALRHKDASLSTQMDYCHFLYNIKDYSTALPILDEIIETQEISDGHHDGNSYGEIELLTTDANLQQEIQAHGGDVYVNPSIYAYYIKVQILHESMRLGETDDLLKRFWKICKKLEKSLKEPSKKGMCWNLYGYAAKDAGKFQDAKQGFRKALMRDPRLPLAEGNMDTCDALMISLEIGHVGTVHKEPLLGSQDLPPEIDAVRNLHSMYLSMSDQKQKASLEKTIITTCTTLLSDSRLAGFIQTDFANFLLQIQKADQALGILDELLQKESFENSGDLKVTCYRPQDMTIVDDHIKQEIKKVEKAQLVILTLACGFYLKVQALIQLQRLSEAKKLLRKLEDACFETLHKDIDPMQKELFFTLHTYASKDLQAYSPTKAIKINSSPAKPVLPHDVPSEDKLDPECHICNLPHTLEKTVPTDAMQILPLLRTDTKGNEDLSEAKTSTAKLASQAKKAAGSLPFDVPDATQIIKDFLEATQVLRSLHLQYTQSNNDAQRQDLKKDIKIAYDKNVELSGAQMTIVIDYANFLYQIEQYEHCLDILNEVTIHNESQVGIYDIVAYSQSEAPLVDLNILSEIVNYDAEVMPLPFQCYAFYLKVHCLHKLAGKQTEAVDALVLMIATSESVRPTINNKLMAMWYILTGHAARDISQYQVALKAFQRAGTLQPQNITVQEHAQQCEELLLDRRDSQKEQVDQVIISEPSLSLHTKEFSEHVKERGASTPTIELQQQDQVVISEPSSPSSPTQESYPKAASSEPQLSKKMSAQKLQEVIDAMTQDPKTPDVLDLD